jgi:hypothetical protein
MSFEAVTGLFVDRGASSSPGCCDDGMPGAQAENEARVEATGSPTFVTGPGANAPPSIGEVVVFGLDIEILQRMRLI